MQVAIVFLLICSAATIISADTYHVDRWWQENYFLKFNPPGGNSFYINFYDGTICNMNIIVS